MKAKFKRPKELTHRALLTANIVQPDPGKLCRSGRVIWVYGANQKMSDLE